MVSTRGRFLGAFALAVAAAVVVLLFARAPLATALYGGFLGVAVLTGLLFSLLEMAVPGRVIQWRTRIMASWRGPLAGIGGAFTRATATGDEEPWTSRKAQRRVRVVGAGLFVAMVIVGVLVLAAFKF